MKLLLLAGLGMCLAGAGQAQTQTERLGRISSLSGVKLMEICTSRDRNVQSDCTGYVDGISDTVGFYQLLRPRDGSKGPPLPEYICVPQSETGIQLREKVVAWGKANQARLSTISAVGTVLRALNETYACPGEQARK